VTKVISAFVRDTGCGMRREELEHFATLGRSRAAVAAAAGAGAALAAAAAGAAVAPEPRAADGSHLGHWSVGAKTSMSLLTADDGCCTVTSRVARGGELRDVAYIVFDQALAAKRDREAQERPGGDVQPGERWSDFDAGACARARAAHRGAPAR
jgi:hypothetical protein